MKIKRQKKAKNTISFYKYNFGFREPFQLLLDGTFCQAALKNQIQIKEQMPKYFMGEVQLCTTNCALKELETLPKDLYGAKVILQRFQIRKCKHSKMPVPASQCLLSVVGETNPYHYFVATQDRELASSLMIIPGVPLLHIIQNTIVLDKISACSRKHVEAVQLGELVTPVEHQTLQTLKAKQGLNQVEGSGKDRKRKRKSGNPNPLSCLKKKKKPMPQQPKKTDGKKKRSRHRKQKPAGLNVSVNTATSSAQS